MHSLIIFFLILFFEQKSCSSGSRYNLIYQKDISEHCRRRVVPSIFLGRQVVEANARIMQFSRLELPYSCFISIRTESGSNMVMVIQLAVNELQKVCDKDTEQLLVYEMGESFGGYWGPFPELVLRPEPKQPKIYTLKTTEFSTMATESSEEETEEVISEEMSTESVKSEQSTSDYIEMEVPLLNVSVQMGPAAEGDADAAGPEDFEAAFDLQNDVTPVFGVSYETSVLPLVQFHVVDHLEGRREGGVEAPRYDLDIVQGFTPDMRLTLPQLNPTKKRRKSHHKQRYQATRRLHFKKHKTYTNSKGYLDRQKLSQTYITRRMNDATKYTFPTMNPPSTDNVLNNTQDSWQVIKDLMEKLDKGKDSPGETVHTTLSLDDNLLLEKISNMKHNISVYLSPNLSLYSNPNNDAKRNRPMISTKTAIFSTWKRISRPIKTKNFNNGKLVTENRSNIKKDLTRSFHLATTENTGMITEIYTKQKIISIATATDTWNISDVPTKSIEVFGNTSETDSSSFDIETAVFKERRKESLVDTENNTKLKTGYMVGHESWDNVVQAAPEMAVLLNQSRHDTRYNTSDDKTDTEVSNKTPHSNQIIKRKKKDIRSIEIKEARPHNLTTIKKMISTTRSSFEVADMQEFAQLVELQDDELHGRVALRYLRQYVGPALFNVCDLADSPQRHVHLFNSSRIVLAVTNFSLERMIIILTAARTLLNGEARCPRSQLECQVSGARVCLDSMAACDGVPNCGSYDIYDEDRLMCGQAVGLRHNVNLAAFTFLAVLLTGLYAVHYWLKRCVPKVAEAFFVYSDGVENVLCLDSIMRAPNEPEDITKMVYHKDLFGDENMYDETYIEESVTNGCQRFLQKICFCCRNKKTDRRETSEPLSRLTQTMPRKMFSFTELEIRKMQTASKDTAVQTGDSLEMKFLENMKNKHDYSTTGKSEHMFSSIGSGTTPFPIMKHESLFTLEDPLPEEHQDELSLLRIFNESRHYSIQPVSSTSKIFVDTNNVSSDEREITSVAYDRHGQSQPGPSKLPPKTVEKTTPSKSGTKQLRFDDITTTIPPVEYDDGGGHTSSSGRRSVALGETRQWRGNWQLDTIDEADEHSTAGKEHRHFWASSKGKKSKKKPRISLR